jgi:hypothetical protein
MNKYVREEDVVCIITSTKSNNLEEFLQIVDYYYDMGDISVDFDCAEFSKEDTLKIAETLYNKGKIHQPRNYSSSPYVHYKFRNQTWLDIVPTNENSNQLVVEAYGKYKMLDALTK